MKKIVDNLLPRIAKVQKMIISKRDEFLNTKVNKFVENYYIQYHREPKEIEIAKFKKDLMMKVGLLAYFSGIILFFFLWLSIQESGVFQ